MPAWHQSELSASYPPPSEREEAEPGPRTTNSSRRTETSSSSRSRLESPLHGNTLDWGWRPGRWEAVSHWSDSLVLSTLSWLATAANCFLVCDRVTLWNSDGWGLAAEMGEGTDLTGSNIFRCSVRGRPFPSSWRTVNTGIDGLSCVVTTYTSFSHLSAILCFPWNPTCLTKTWSPGCKVAPRTFCYTRLC